MMKGPPPPRLEFTYCLCEGASGVAPYLATAR